MKKPSLQLCSSAFVTSEWRESLIRIFDISLTPPEDYRRFIPAHFGLLARLCELSITTIRDTIVAFLSSSFISANLFSESIFTRLIQKSIEQVLQSAPLASSRIITLQRVLMKGNAIITSYGTNWNYNITRPYLLSERHDWFPVDSQFVTYPDGCSCGREMSSCTTQATFLNQSNGQAIEVKGFKRGCLPSESLFASTLECLHDVVCIRLITEHMNMDEVSLSLSRILSFSFTSFCFRKFQFLIHSHEVINTQLI